MIFDFKKEYKELYMPKSKPQIINVPSMNFVSIKGKGDPNEENGAYSQAISILYAISYTLRMSYKGSRVIKGYFEYVVPPLEGFWWQDDIKSIDYNNKDKFNWISVIRLPDFITKEDFDWAVEETSRKKKIDCSIAKFITIEEGLCVQIMHLGSFDSEPDTIEKMNEYLDANGYITDINENRLHHEIYLSDPRKTSAENLKTVIRHPIKEKL